MKKWILTFILLISASAVQRADAQHVNINIGSQPAWGPVGYEYVEYYYIPEIDVYYHVPTHRFHYWNRGRWIRSRYLPHSYHRHYDFYRMYKVVLSDRDPWRRHSYHKRHYARYREYYNQPMIYRSTDHRYQSSRKNRVDWYEGQRGRMVQNHQNGRSSNFGKGTRTEASSRSSNRPSSNSSPSTNNLRRTSTTSVSNPRSSLASTSRNASYSSRKTSGNTSARRSSSAKSNRSNSSASRSNTQTRH